jgi:hypothetical protein
VASLILLGLSVYLAGRLIRFTAGNAVDLLYADQWNYYAPLFAGASPLEAFLWQTGIHRLGVGALFTAAVAQASHWSTRAEALLVAGLFVLNTMLALVLCWRLNRCVRVLDVVIPLLNLNLFQYEALVVIQDASIGALPITFLLLCALALTISRTQLRYPGLVISALLGLYTGYGLLLGAAVPAVLFWLAVCEPAQRRHALAAGILVLLGLASFFIGYDTRAAVAQTSCGPASAADIAQFWALMWNASFQLNYRGVAGLVIPAGIVVGAGVTLVNGLRGCDPRRTFPLLLLFAYSLFFSLLTAAGRICFSVEGALAPRYVSYLVPAFVGLYLVLAGNKDSAISSHLAVLYVVVVTFVSAANSQYLTVAPVDHALRAEKWRTCYLSTEDAARCDAEAGLTLIPGGPTPAGLSPFLAYLKTHHLNLYLDQ